MRLQKYMADAGVASRRKCEELIAQGAVLVNGSVAATGCSVEPGRDEVIYMGRRIVPREERTVYAFYKPQGVICSSSDPQGRETVQDYFRDVPERLYNVGRLDYDSEGLVLMTNDGELANRLTHPSHEVEKTYYVICDGSLGAEEKEKLRTGVMLDDGMSAPARVTDDYKTANGNTSFYIAIHEGRNRQVRRMLAAVGHETLLLRRTAEETVTLGTLKPGEKRKLDAEELDKLRKECL